MGLWSGKFISDENKKRERLYEILQRYKAPIFIFVNHKRTCDVLSKSLEKMEVMTLILL